MIEGALGLPVRESMIEGLIVSESMIEGLLVSESMIEGLLVSESMIEGVDGVRYLPMNDGTDAVATISLDCPFVSTNVIVVNKANITPVKPYVITGTPLNVIMSAILYIILWIKNYKILVLIVAFIGATALPPPRTRFRA